MCGQRRSRGPHGWLATVLAVSILILPRARAGGLPDRYQPPPDREKAFAEKVLEGLLRAGVRLQARLLSVRLEVQYEQQTLHPDEQTVATSWQARYVHQGVWTAIRMADEATRDIILVAGLLSPALLEKMGVHADLTGLRPPVVTAVRAEGYDRCITDTGQAFVTRWQGPVQVREPGELFVSLDEARPDAVDFWYVPVRLAMRHPGNERCQGYGFPPGPVDLDFFLTDLEEEATPVAGHPVVGDDGGLFVGSITWTDLNLRQPIRRRVRYAGMLNAITVNLELVPIRGDAEPTPNRP